MLLEEDAWNDAGRARVESLLQNALRLKPRYEPALLLLAKVYQDGGDEARALQTYQVILQANPRSVEARKALTKLEAAGAVSGGTKGVANRIGGLLGRLRKG